MVTLARAQQLAGLPGVVDQIDVQFRPGVDPDEAQGLQSPGFELPPTAIVQTPASASTGVNRILRNARVLLILIAAHVFLAAGVIIFTSLTTSVTQRLRELAILRCVVAGRVP